MKDHRRRAWLTYVVGGLLLTSCAAPRAAAYDESPDHTAHVRSSRTAHWWHAHADIHGARARATGAGRRIAIVDTGLISHEDLPDPVYAASTCVGKDQDRTDVTDRNGHGTELAGIVVGKYRGAATRGIASGASLIVVKVDCGVVQADPLMEGVDTAINVDPAPDVILLAMPAYPPGGSYTPPDVTAPFTDVASFLQTRIKAHPEILFVVASIWDDAIYPRPAWTQYDNVVVVAPMKLDVDRDSRGTEVPYNPSRGDVWAPGKDVDTASIDRVGTSERHDSYLMQGSSPAAAIVAACALLVKEKTPIHVAATSGKELKEALTKTGNTEPIGGGAIRRLNCDKAVPNPKSKS